MSDNERRRGIGYYVGTKIWGGTTARVTPHPIYPVEGGSEDGYYDSDPEFESGPVDRIGPNQARIARIQRNHAIYSHPAPKKPEDIRYVRIGGWQEIAKQDKGKGFQG